MAVKAVAPAFALARAVVPVLDPLIKIPLLLTVLTPVIVCAVPRRSTVSAPVGIVTLLIVVAVAAPRTGVTNVGDVANTRAPVPVSSVTAAIKLALDGVARKVATPVPKPVIPVTGIAVAVIDPLPDVVRLAPVPTTAAIVVLVPLVRALNALDPLPQSEPVPVKSPALLKCAH